MQHIASKGIVHRNLSAGKIWLFGTIIAKISDFNLCCFHDENSSYKEDLVEKFSPKQLALESLVDKAFSEKSDVWSFGVLVYEMFGFGKVPYEDLDSEKLVEFLKDGHRLERLENMNENLYEILTSCWDVDPEARPDFKELEKKFHEFIEIRSEIYGYVEARN